MSRKSSTALGSTFGRDDLLRLGGTLFRPVFTPAPSSVGSIVRRPQGERQEQKNSDREEDKKHDSGIDPRSSLLASVLIPPAAPQLGLRRPAVGAPFEPPMHL